jgi:hypothetical protein
MGGGGFHRPKTWDGLMMCFNDAVPFYRNGLITTLVASAVLFTGYLLLKPASAPSKQAA